MKEHHKMRIVNWGTAIIVLGLLFIGWQKYIDGTIVDRPSVYHEQKISLPFPTAFFNPVPIGSVVGVYQVKTEKTEYKPGDNVYILLSFCKYTQKTPTVSWTFENDITANLGARPGQIVEPGCYTNKRILIGSIPDEFSTALPKSKYSLHGMISYSNYNPFRTISYLLVSNSFIIKN